MYLVSAFVNDKCREDVSIIECGNYLDRDTKRKKNTLVGEAVHQLQCLIRIEAIFRLIVKHSGHDVTSFEITRTIMVYYSFVCKEIHDNVRI